MSNLLTNAIKFTNEGTVSITEIVVSMSDTDCGTDPEILPRPFTKFKTKSTNGYLISMIEIAAVYQHFITCQNLSFYSYIITSQRYREIVGHTAFLTSTIYTIALATSRSQSISTLPYTKFHHKYFWGVNLT